MSTSPEPTTTGGTPLNASYCDVCSVVRDPGGLAIHFGERVHSTLDPQAFGVALRHRVVLGEGTAHKLLDLMTALLNESTGPRDIR